MNWLNKIEARQTPPGLEMVILRRLPRLAVLGSMIPLALAVGARVWPGQPGIDATKFVRTADILAIAIEVTLLTAVFTVAIGAVVVFIMKGPAYVADAYPVAHADEPDDTRPAHRR